MNNLTVPITNDVSPQKFKRENGYNSTTQSNSVFETEQIMTQYDEYSEGESLKDETREDFS